jgi:hypothetical protein
VPVLADSIRSSPSIADCRYLTEIGKVDVYWTGSRLKELSILPPIGANLTRQAIVPLRYHFNTGTPRHSPDSSDILLYDSMVGMGTMGTIARLDGPARDKPPSCMVSLRKSLTTGLDTNPCFNKSSSQ